ncbi:MAG: RrF2 family transcriptional regulator [bacterium]
MKLSTKCRYGLRALIEIAKNSGKGPAKRKDIASSQEISDPYLESILLTLKQSRIINTTRGAKGGYVLCRPAAQITVLDVVNAFEGPLTLVDCLQSPNMCSKVTFCVTRTIWRELQDTWRSILEGTTLQDLLDKEHKQQALTYAI